MLKRVISLLLCAVMCISVFSMTATEVFAVGSVDSIFSVENSGFENGTITYTVSLLPDQTKVAGAIIKIKYDSTVLKVSDGSGAVGKKNSYGELVANVTGVYESGKLYNDSNVYSIAFMNTNGYTVGDTAKEFVKVTFELCSENRPYTDVEIICEEFITDDGNASNDILKSDASQKIYTDRFFTLGKVQVTEVNSSTDGLSVSWDKVTGAEYYDVYRKTADSSWSFLETVDGSVTEYTDRSVALGVEYSYTVASGNSYGATAYDETGVAGMKFGTVAEVNANATPKGVQVSWTALNGAESYGVFRKTADSEWKEVGTTTDLTYEDTSAPSGSEYLYTVKAYKGRYSAESSCEPASVWFIKTPEFSNPVINNGSIVINWYSVAGAESYKVYRKTVGQANYTQVAEVEYNIYTDTNVQNGVEYSYKLQTVNSKGNSVIAESSREVMKLPVTSGVTAALEEESVTVSWQAVSFAEKYRLWRKTGTGSWIALTTVNSGVTEYKDTTITSGRSYTYAVSTVYGEYETAISEPSETIILIAPPQINSVTKVASGFEISFTKVSGADSYVIYRKQANGDFKKIAEVDSSEKASYVDKSVSPGVRYVYGVSVICDGYESDMAESSPVCDLATPTLSNPELAYNGIILKWSAVAGAEKYVITYGTAYNSINKVIAEVGGSVTTYTHKGALSGDTNFYNVTAVCGDSKTTSNYKGTYFLMAPTASVSNVSGGIKISWNAMGGAESYDVYRKVSGEKEFSYIGSTTSTSYTDKTVKNGVTYVYTVSTNDGGEKSKYSPDGWSIKYYTTPADPTLSKAANANGGVTVTWKAVSGADSYRVYRKTSSSGWTCLNSKVTSTSYTDKSAKSGTTYYYTVRAENEGGLSGYNSTGVSVKYLAMPTVTIANAATGVKVSWNKITGASKYYVYRKASGDKSWTQLTNSATGTSYTDTKAKSGTTYYYTVKAVSGSVSSAYKSSSALKYLAQPKVSSLSNTNSGITVKWNKITGASGYYVYRKTGSGSWSLIYTVKSGSTVSYTDKSVKAGTTYYYTVRAYSGSVKSTYTASSAVRRLTTPTLKSVSSAKSGITFKWSKVTGASGYYVYRKTGSGSWQKIATIKSGSTVSYLDKTAKKGTTYTYTVKAYYSSNVSAYNTTGLKIKDKY